MARSHVASALPDYARSVVIGGGSVQPGVCSDCYAVSVNYSFVDSRQLSRPFGGFVRVVDSSQNNLYCGLYRVDDYDDFASKTYWEFPCIGVKQGNVAPVFLTVDFYARDMPSIFSASAFADPVISMKLNVAEKSGYGLQIMINKVRLRNDYSVLQTMRNAYAAVKGTMTVRIDHGKVISAV